MRLERHEVYRLIGASESTYADEIRRYGGRSAPLVSIDDIHPYTDRVSELIARLSKAAQIELAAMAWLGRGTVTSFATALAEAERKSDIDFPDYLSGMPLYQYLPKAIDLISEEGFTFADESR